MFCLDHKNEIQTFLKNKVANISLNSVSYEDVFNLSLKQEILIIHEFWLQDEKLTSSLSEVESLFVWGENSEKQIQLKNFCGFLNAKNSQSLNLIMTLNQIELRQKNLKNKLLSLNQSIDALLEKNQDDVLRLKRIFEKNAPKRKESLKGLSFVAKYAAGERGGGEFFDTVKFNNQLLFLISSCSSYLASSGIMTLFSDLRKIADISEEHVDQFVLKTINELKTMQQEEAHLESNMIVALVDLKSLSINGYIFGEFNIISTNHKNLSRGNLFDIDQENIQNAKFKMKLTREERLLLVSPGFIRNWERIKPTTTINELVSNNQINISDVLDELFFQIKKDSDEMFLHRDASAIMLEVDHNVILKI